MKITDLSVEIKNSNSEPMKLKHSRINHKDGAKKIANRAGISINSFPQNEFITLDTYEMATHMGTHLDSPFHFGSRFRGLKARTVDQLPLNWFYRPAVKLDFREFPRKTNITSKDVLAVLKRENLEIHPKDIVLIWTGMDQLFGTKEYFTDGPGMSAGATKLLIDMGVKVMGIDSYGFDRSFPVMLEEFKKSGDASVLWPSHFLGRKSEYVHVERMTNFEKLPSKGFKVSVLPLKLIDGDASWVRAVAIEE